MFLLLNDTLRQKLLTGVGFEPAHPKILRPERSALDRSAILPDKTFFVSFCFCCYICSSASDCLSQYVETRISAMFLLLNDTLRQKLLTGVGFEPTHPKILRPERSALDRSAILPAENVFRRAFVFVVTSAHQRQIVDPNMLKNEFQRCFYC